MSNKYYFRAQISERKFRTVLRLFSLDIEAKKVAEFTGLSRGCVNNIFNKLRERIAELCEAESPFENGEIELDESYFGARRVRGKRGRGAQGKTPVFGMLKEVTEFTLRSSKTALQASSCLLFRAKPTPMQSSILTALGPMTGWQILVIKSIIGSNMARMNFLRKEGMRACSQCRVTTENGVSICKWT